MFSMFHQLPAVTKNILILNILFYIATLVLGSKGIDLIQLLGAHYINSPLFQPYQVITHFFMHSTSIFHLLFNMMGVVIFGSLLEKMWGPKRFFVFYIASAIGAFALYNLVGAFQVMELKQTIVGFGYNIDELNNAIMYGSNFEFEPAHASAINSYAMKVSVPMVGASGAVFGIMAGFAYLFPNTEIMMLFIPFPIKAKFLVGGYFLIELYYSFNNMAGDSVAHLAHVGGAITGLLIVLFWRKNRNTFY
jgi:membrane associated rhomboid family serine protease